MQWKKHWKLSAFFSITMGCCAFLLYQGQVWLAILCVSILAFLAIAVRYTQWLGMISFGIFGVLATIICFVAINQHIDQSLTNLLMFKEGDYEPREDFGISKMKAGLSKKINSIVAEIETNENVKKIQANPEGEESSKIQKDFMKAMPSDAKILREILPIPRQFSDEKIDKTAQGTILLYRLEPKNSEIIKRLLTSIITQGLQNINLSDKPDLMETALQQAYRRDKNYQELVDALEFTKKQLTQATMLPWGLSAMRTSALINGLIQFMTVIAFWFGFFLSLKVLVRVLFIQTDGEKLGHLHGILAGRPRIMHHKKSQNPNAPDTDRSIALQIQDKNTNTRIEQVSLRILNASFIQGSQDSMRETLEKCCGEMREQTEVDLEFCRYIAWLIPSLGFVGTVVGIGDALLSADRMVNAPPAMQGDEIANITACLGMAFDTTLVSLIGSIIAVLFIHCIQYIIERRIMKLKEYCNTNLIEKAQF